MTLKLVVYILIGLAIAYRFIIKPLINSVISIYEVSNTKKNIQKLGCLLQKNESGKQSKFKAICLICFIIITPISVIFKTYELLIGSFYLLYLFFSSLRNENYSKYNGIYENGLINQSILYWDDVFSYKIINEDTISLLLKNGLRYDLQQMNNITQVLDMLKVKEIKKEN